MTDTTQSDRTGVPTRTFEGPDLDATLAKARESVGGTGRIIRAERVRSGGMGGFFAKEWVEVEVELDGETEFPAPAEGSAATEPTFPTVKEFFQKAAQRRGANKAAAQETYADAAEEESRPALDIAELADLVSDVEHTIAEGPVQVSTEGHAFASVFERIRHEAGDDAPTTPAAAVKPDAPTAPAAAVKHVAPATPAATARPAVTIESPVKPTAPVQFVEPAPAALAVLDALPVPEPSPAAGALMRLGVPAELLPMATSPADIEHQLITALAALPAAPPLPTTRGTVLAVVGPRRSAQETIDALGIEPADVVTVTRRRKPGQQSLQELTRLDEVAEQRKSWRRRSKPTVVIIDGATCPSPTWEFDVLECLEPTVTWGLAEATRKAEDIAAWAEGLGGLDALAVVDVDNTTTPASVLELGIPIGLVDGEAATPERWATMLLDRVLA